VSCIPNYFKNSLKLWSLNNSTPNKSLHFQNIMIEVLHAWHSYIDCWTLVEVMGQSVVSYCEHLGKHIGNLWTCQKCIKNFGCSHIRNLMWTHMINNLVCTWWEDIENIKIKKCSKLPLIPERKKIWLLGACCITSWVEQNFFPQKCLSFFFN
jgi:hypothetical protein